MALLWAAMCTAFMRDLTTDDTTFERKSRDLVTLYRSVIKTAGSCITEQPAPDL